ncbi:putative uncharacterized protein sll0782 [Fusobacterium sp. CAG:439]|mgnify:CR=1 FL=1|nr:putative uncharacterized protein sll0782 [Fusobacterium sp. CAG:439]
MNKELLTEQEHKMLQLFAKSYNRKNIADELNISYSSCRKLVNALLKKFEADNLTSCLIKAYDEGFIKL